MRKVRCYECGKSYDYYDDAFCPGCGAFNQPPHSTRVGADGSIVRVDGIREVNHKGSFLHQEYHKEEKIRKKSGLDKGVQRIPRPQNAQKTSATRKQEQVTPAAILRWIVIAFVILQVLGQLFLSF